jgi:hypothetical protein
MPNENVSKRYRITVRVSEETYKAFKELITHYGQQSYELEQAVIERTRKLQQTKATKKLAS